MREFGVCPTCGSRLALEKRTGYDAPVLTPYDKELEIRCAELEAIVRAVGREPSLCVDCDAQLRDGECHAGDCSWRRTFDWDKAHPEPPQ